MGKWEMYVMTLNKIRLDHTFSYIADKFNISPATVSKYFYASIDVIYSKFKSIVLWPESDMNIKSLPVSFKEVFGDKSIVILDCFEVFIQHPG
jgi:hypothetical protein